MRERTRLLAVLAAVGGGRRRGRPCGPPARTSRPCSTGPRPTSLKFIGQFENVVAEEVYVQEMSSPRRKRTIKSDFLFVKYPDVAGSMALRDVFEVDGKPVRDAAQADRMMKLFTSPVPNAVLRARALAEEGARYNLLDIGTLNNPVVAMVFLQPDYRPRFRFNLAGIEKNLGPTIRTVRFEEFRIPTILRDRRQPGPAVARADLGGRGDRPRGEDAASGRAARGSRRRSSPPTATSRSSASTCRPRCGTGIPTAAAATSAGSRPTAASGASR